MVYATNERSRYICQSVVALTVALTEAELLELLSLVDVCRAYYPIFIRYCNVGIFIQPLTKN